MPDLEPQTLPLPSPKSRKPRGLAVIPAYNEEGRIAPVIKELKRVTHRFDVLVVDDGSRDHTAGEALAAGALVVRHPFNMGYGAALQTGYKFAATSSRGYDVLVQLDADGQHDPKYVEVLAARVRTGEVDVCIGSRFLVGKGYIPPFARRVGMVLFGYIASVVTRRRVTDPTSGYQALGRRVFEYFQLDLFPADYPDADVLILLHRAGFRAEEQPVEMQPDPSGQSMHGGLLRPMFYVFKMFLSIFVTLLREPPPPPPK